jgi:RNA 3'-terminal phosphate cyclase (ATP)
MIEIDGSQKSGSGTILRISIALSAIKQEPLHIFNIRYNRKKPGLRPQHLQSVKTAAKLCNAKIKGAKLDSTELWFNPNKITSNNLLVEIGTAGSIPMLLLTILPICMYAEDKIQLHIMNGGTDVWHAPTINYLKYVLFPVLKKMGLNAFLKIKKYGYYPRGMGEVIFKINPITELNPVLFEDFGEIEEIKGISICTFLEKQKVAERQAIASKAILNNFVSKPKIRIINDKSNTLQKGSSIVLYAKTNKGARLGGDAIGELGKSSELVGSEAAQNLKKEIDSKATVDVHLADMLIPYIALAKRSSIYITREITDHISTNIWLTEKILNKKIKVKKINNLFQIST